MILRRSWARPRSLAQPRNAIIAIQVVRARANSVQQIDSIIQNGNRHAVRAMVCPQWLYFTLLFDIRI